jgi:hypothetical protein
MKFTKTTQDLQNSEPEGRETEADRWGLLTDGTHATERQEAETSSSPANLDDGEVSVESKGTVVTLSPRRTCRGAKP